MTAFIGFTVFIMGFAAYMTGKGLANSWAPLPRVFFSAALLGLADRFLTFALFDGQLLSLGGYLLDTAVITSFALFAFRLTMTGKMVSQYPWLYERDGLLGWREIV